MKNFKQKIKFIQNENQDMLKLKKNHFFNLKDIKEVTLFHDSIGIRETPLINLPALAKHLNVKNIFIKDESQRYQLKAFKVLGSSYAMHKQIIEKPTIKVFCTATDGNHGKSVAHMAKKMGRESIIYVPKDTVSERIKSIESEGAKVVLTNQGYDVAVEMARDYASKENKRNGGYIYSLIQDTAWKGYHEVPLNIMKGYLTQIKEITKQIKNEKIDVIFVQIGVGSWAASILGYVQKYWSNLPIFISVEPFSADCIFKSISLGIRTSVNTNEKTIMAGLNCGKISTLAWPILKYGLKYSLSISDELVEEAMKILAHPLGNDPIIISGESGAAPLAGLMGLLKKSQDSYGIKNFINKDANILIINTEGDTDTSNYQRIICN